jgi:phage terminase large subunit
MTTNILKPNSHLRPSALHYFRAGHEAGCPPDQLQNFVRAGIVLQPQQLLASAVARRCDDPSSGLRAIGFGGARGGGKSHWLVAQIGADDCQRAPGLNCLLLRKVGKANIEHFESLRHKLFWRLRHEYNSSRGLLTFANGSKIVTGHFQAEKDIDTYLGLEYDIIGIEEATTLTERKYRDISTCCRTARPDWRPRIYSTTNPGGVGHQWYRKLFIDTDASPRTTAFIPARVGHNRFLDGEYAQRLAELTGWQKRAWLEGDWDITAGQFFVHFRQDVHVQHDFDPGCAVEWWGALDYGFTHHTAFLLGAKDGDGAIHIVDEHAEQRWLVERHAQAIRALLGRHHLTPVQLRKIVAGADIFALRYDGTSIADEYSRHGLKLRCANTDRINGWAEITRRLGDVQAGLRPTLFIHPRCARLVACIPALQHDPNRPEDVLKVDTDEDTGEGGDDTADALRYLVHSHPATLTTGKLKS